MLELITRALLHPLDYIGFFRKRTLVLKEHIDEGNNIYSFVFTSDTPFTWKAGQHGVFSFPHKKVSGKTWRAFSIASAPYEKVVRIATVIKDEPSDFKRQLLALTPGETITLHGPFGEMYVRPHMKHIVGIAGGIGITPFRALIHALHEGSLDTKLTLIYSAVGSHIYKSKFDEILPHKNIRIIYTHTPQEVEHELSALTSQYKDATYFLSGSPGMITALRKALIRQSIKDIVNDTFKGY
jgi:ferredoxin-NADP reductase